MALTYNTLSSYVANTRYPELVNGKFVQGNLVVRMLFEKSIQFKGRQILMPIVATQSSQGGFISQMDTLNLNTIDPVTSAAYTPAMYATTLTISKEDELRSQNADEIFSLVDTHFEVTKRSVEEDFATSLWSRTAYSSGAGWLNLENILSTSSTLGGIAVADFAEWIANVIDASTDYASGNSQVLADLSDPTLDVYIVKLIRSLVARCRYRSGRNPDLITVGTQIFDLLQNEMKTQFTGSKITDVAAELGVPVITYDGIVIAPEERQVTDPNTASSPQTADTDGRIYAFSFMDAEPIDDGNYTWKAGGMGYAINPMADHAVSEFVKPANQLSRTMNMIIYGNLVCNDRDRQGVTKNIFTDADYASG